MPAASTLDTGDGTAKLQAPRTTKGPCLGERQRPLDHGWPDTQITHPAHASRATRPAHFARPPASSQRCVEGRANGGPPVHVRAGDVFRAARQAVLGSPCDCVGGYGGAGDVTSAAFSGSGDTAKELASTVGRRVLTVLDDCNGAACLSPACSVRRAPAPQESFPPGTSARVPATAGPLRDPDLRRTADGR